MAKTETNETPAPLATNSDQAAAPYLTAIEYRLLVEHSPVLIWRADLNK